MSDQRGLSSQQPEDRMQDGMNESRGMDGMRDGDLRTSGNENSESVSETRSNRTSSRGFAAMSPERQKQIASEGGRAAHKQGVAHEWNSDEARKAGRKGGEIVSRNREHMSEIGRRGGQSSGGRRSRNQQNDSNGETPVERGE